MYLLHNDTTAAGSIRFTILKCEPREESQNDLFQLLEPAILYLFVLIINKPAARISAIFSNSDLFFDKQVIRVVDPCFLSHAGHKKVRPAGK